MTSRKITRREFVRDGAVATGAVVLGLNSVGRAEEAKPASAGAVEKTRSYNPNMEYRRLGRTGLWVSAVCLGGHWKGMERVLKGPVPGLADPVVGEAGAELLKNRREVVDRCLEVGINLVDACTVAEVSAYGPALKGQREKMYMGFAMWPKCPRDEKYRTADMLLKTLGEGMKIAGVDYVDVWRPVALERGGEHTQAEVEEMVKALAQAKKQGKARFTGVSSHDREWLKMLIEKYPEQMEVIVFPYAAMSKELPKDSLFDAIRKQDIGALGIKPFGGGSYFHDAKKPEDQAKLARLAVRYVLGNPAITAPIPGLACPAEVDNMALAIKEKRELDKDEKAMLENAAERMWANLPPQYQWLENWRNV
jgi:aryl-alcohol dehydrogenase-like predicted oxidoreductase